MILANPCASCSPTSRRLLHGLRGLAKAVLKLDRASPSLVAHRRAVCAECVHAVPCRRGGEPCFCGPLWDGIRGHVSTCGCAIHLKTRVKGEACPKAAW